jgi:hypothetical protein
MAPQSGRGMASRIVVGLLIGWIRVALSEQTFLRLNTFRHLAPFLGKVQVHQPRI